MKIILPSLLSSTSSSSLASTHGCHIRLSDCIHNATPNNTYEKCENEVEQTNHRINEWVEVRKIDRVRCTMEFPIISINLKLFDSIIVNAGDVSRNSPSINIRQASHSIYLWNEMRFVFASPKPLYYFLMAKCIHCEIVCSFQFFVGSVLFFPSISFHFKGGRGGGRMKNWNNRHFTCSWMRMSSFSISFQINLTTTITNNNMTAL